MMKPIIVLSSAEHNCATFVWSDDLRYFVGYRFVEHRPKSIASPLPHLLTNESNPPSAPSEQYPRADDWLDNWQTTYAESDHPLHLRFQTGADGSALASVSENNGLQQRMWRFVPEENGVRLWMTLQTDEIIPGGYIVQQCLRFSSGIGLGFRRTVASVPFLSELLMQALGNANGTITWVRRNNEWQRFPLPFTRYNTTVGAGIYDDSSGQIDSGLIVRETASRANAPADYWLSTAPEATWQTFSAGLYWERTTYVSNRHPADCIHSGVDFGPLKAGASRTVQGKFYWIEGTKDDLLAVWQKDFGKS